jgi:hypothetical protein
MTAGDPTQPAHPRAEPTRVYTGPGPGGGGTSGGGPVGGGPPGGQGDGDWGGGWSQSQRWLVGIICAVIAITAFVLVIFVFSGDDNGGDTLPTTVATQPSTSAPATSPTTGQSTTQAPATTTPTTTPPSTGIVITLLPPTS